MNSNSYKSPDSMGTSHAAAERPFSWGWLFPLAAAVPLALLGAAFIDVAFKESPVPHIHAPLGAACMATAYGAGLLALRMRQ